MSNLTDHEDPQGYARLSEALVRFGQRLQLLGDTASAHKIREAARLYGGGSPTEFLGESRLALQSVLASAHGLPTDLISAMSAIVDDINDGFKRVGGG